MSLRVAKKRGYVGALFHCIKWNGCYRRNIRHWARIICHYWHNDIVMVPWYYWLESLCSWPSHQATAVWLWKTIPGCLAMSFIICLEQSHQQNRQWRIFTGSIISMVETCRGAVSNGIGRSPVSVPWEPTHLRIFIANCTKGEMEEHWKLPIDSLHIIQYILYSKQVWIQAANASQRSSWPGFPFLIPKITGRSMPKKKASPP